jgi:Xaa-Pro aminopeptidase
MGNVVKSLFNSDFFKQNRKNLRERVKKSGLIIVPGNGLLQKSLDSAYPFRQDSNFFYLTGLSEPGLVLVVDRDKEYLIMPYQSDYMQTFDGEIKALKLRQTSGIQKVLNSEDGWKQLGKKLKQSKYVAGIVPPPEYVEELGLYTNPARRQLQNRVYEENKKIKFVDIKSELAELRIIKQPLEIKAIKRATDVTMQALASASRLLSKSHTEYELAAEITKTYLNNNMIHAYEPIVAAGDNATTLHYIDNDDSFRANQLVLFDVGADCEHYASDISRTIVDSPTQRQKDIHSAVKDVHSFALGILRPGLSFRDFERQTRDEMGKKLVELKLSKRPGVKTVRRYYPHSTTHPIGLDVHDPMPADGIIRPGMVISCEPGLYIKEEGIGIRLEDIIYIKNDGIENLSARLSMGISKLTID